MITYLTIQQILFVHARLIGETGGSHGIRDLKLLQSAQARPQAAFDGKDLYSDIFIKAAALMYSIVNNHPFIDGNKRTGITTAGLFLAINGHRLIASNDELESFTMQVAAGNKNIEEMTIWFKNFSQPVD